MNGTFLFDSVPQTTEADHYRTASGSDRIPAFNERTVVALLCALVQVDCWDPVATAPGSVIMVRRFTAPRLLTALCADLTAIPS